MYFPRKNFLFTLALISVFTSSIAVAQSIDSSKKRLFSIDGKKYDFTVEKFKASPALEVPPQYADQTTPENALLTAFAAMKRGDVKTFKTLNTSERLKLIEKFLKDSGATDDDLPRIWKRSFERSIFLTHRINYKDSVLLVVQRVKPGESLPVEETEIGLSRSELFAFVNVNDKWLLTDARGDPVFCCWYTRTGKPELVLR